MDLEAPADATDDWSRLYRARGDEVAGARPVFTGDVLEKTPVLGGPKPKTVMIVQHPCAMRVNGVDLVPRLLVAELRRHKVLEPAAWTGNSRVMPLPDLLPGVTSGRRHQAAFFTEIHLAESEELGPCIASLSPRGVSLLLQRWVHHNSRVVVPTQEFTRAVGGVYEEADLIEEWCEERDAIDVATATAECVSWLREDVGNGRTRQKQLEEEQNRSNIRKDLRRRLRELG